jgi:hypothetical protein
MRRYLLLLCATLVFNHLFSQDHFEIGPEYLKMLGSNYNSTKVAIRGESFSQGKKGSMSVGITYQLASNKSYSVSTGFGIFAGYRYAFSSNINGNSPFAGARVLISFENFAGKSRQNSILVTPLAEVGYHLVIGKHIFTAPAFGFGYTLQVTGDYNSLNEDVGKRFVPSLSAGYRFN